MNDTLFDLIETMNPWLESEDICPSPMNNYTPRLQSERMLLPDWDRMGVILAGPRMAGKTTLGKKIAQTLIEMKRYEKLLYLDCDSRELRYFLDSPAFIGELMERFKIERPVLFLGNVQCLENPAQLLKEIIALDLPIKLIASTSSQLDLKDAMKEFLILPFSHRELGVSQTQAADPDTFNYGLFPAVVKFEMKERLLEMLYHIYLKGDIIGRSMVTKPDVMQRLIPLLAHTAGELVNYTDLARDARASVPTIQNYCSILEKTYIISRLTPFVGNKRKELVSNPIYYFIDSGFRNAAQGQFSSFVTKNVIYQELLKFKVQSFGSFDIHYWRTQSGAEVDFVLNFNGDTLIPIESKYIPMQRPTVSRSYRSFLKAYSPKVGFIITDNFSDHQEVEGCMVHFIPLQHLTVMLDVIPN